jgi:hypothetical protein
MNTPDSKPKRVRVHCNQCEMLMINGVACHETGCPNSGAQWNEDRQAWVKYFECRECGCEVEQGESCNCTDPIEETPVTHFIAMSGSHGCLPDHCEVFETCADSVEDLTNLFELGRTRKARLAKFRYLELTREDGAEYCEITECDCATPGVHSDSGEVL